MSSHTSPSPDTVPPPGAPGPRQRQQRRRRWRRWLVRGVLITGWGLVGVFAVLVIVIVRYGRQDRARPADVIIVLGGGDVGTARRTEHAVALYDRGYAPYLLCSGAGGAINEARYCAALATAAGVPAEAIILEERSRSTEENAIECGRIMAAQGWTQAVLVSDDFHLWRAHWLFEQHGVRVWPSPAQITSGGNSWLGQSHDLVREVAATGWHVLKSVLGLPHTNLEGV
jgi:uncharacterized SAM-binding protein YcdF (DUF218 family)